MATAPDTMRQVRVPLSDILASGGSITMDDVRDAADGGDDSVTHFMAAPASDAMAPRVDAEPGALLGEDMRPIQGSREATGLADEAAANGAAQPQAGAPMVPQAPDVKAGIENDPSMGGEQRGPRQRITPTTRFNPNYRYTNEDFYGQKGQDIYSTNVFGQKLFMPRAGELPMGLFASYAQQNQQQRAQNKEAIAKLLSGTKNLETADPYQPAFTKLVTDWQNNFISGLAEQYGGNKDLAWRETAAPGSEANKAYLDGMAAMDALGQFVKFQWGDAQAYIKDVMDAKINTTPEQRQLAEDVFYGIGSLKGDGTGGDFVKLAQKVEALKRNMNTSKYIEERVQPFASTMYSKIMSTPIAETRNGKRFLRLPTREEAVKKFYEYWATEGEKFTGVPKAELEDAIRFAIPPVKSDTYTMVSAETGGDGSSGSSANKAKAWVGDIEVGPSATAGREGSKYDMGDAIRGKVQGTEVGGGVVKRRPMGQVVGGRNEPMGVRRFTTEIDGKTQEVEMLPSYIEQDANGDMFVSGLWVQSKSKTETSAAEDEYEAPGEVGGDVESTKTTYEEKGPIRVPVRGNESRLSQYMGGVDWRSGFGAPASRKSAAAKKATTSKPKTVVQNGVTYTLNEQTGQYE